jgi:WD40 repeat protein
MPEETNRARRESGALKSWLENIESISKIAAAIAIPIVIAVGGWWIQSSLSTQAVSKDYVTSTIDSSKKIAFWRGFSVVSALAYSPDGQKLLFGTSEGVVKLWNLKTGEILNFEHEKGAITAAVTAVAFTSGGNNVIVRDLDDRIQTFDGAGKRVGEVKLRSGEGN